MFLRAHNAAAKAIREFDPTMNDDDIYDNAREMATAFFQRLVYKEWLPILLGPAAYHDFFQTEDANNRTTYDKTVNIHFYK